MENIPAFREDPYLVGASDYVAKLRFQTSQRTSKTWEELDARLLKNESFGQTLLDTGFLTAIGDSLRMKYPDTLARLTSAHTYVKQHLIWNGAHNLWADNLREVFNRKKGDAADLNLLLVALLRATGLEAYPLALSTRDNGQILAEYPSLTSFNYVAALTTLGGKDIFLDATLPYLPPDLLPSACLNGKGRVVDLAHARWVSLIPRQRMSVSTTFRMAFGPDGTLSGQAEMACAGYAALLWRMRLSAKDTSSFLQKTLEKSIPNFTVSQPSFANADSLAKPLYLRCTLQSREPLQQAGERYYFMPLLGSERSENPFKAPTRTYPVDFGFPLEETNFVEYTLPPGITVEELPKAATFTLPDNYGRFMYSVILNGNKLQISSRLVLRKPSFTGGEYSTLRAFFDKIVAKHAEQVVLKRE
ncbi:MAG: hypothetical protein H7Y12_00855 [Sphingobacteriaceae bacterium]|nr:hypothetical protein [Cytophagaceae bacterium]